MSKNHHLPNDEFLASLSTLLTNHTTPNNTNPSLSVFLTQKPLLPSTPKDSSSSPTTTTTSSPTPLLIRATCGHSASSSKHTTNGKVTKATKQKLSTVVQPEDLEGFFARYADVCKGGMAALKKRDRKKAKERKKGKKGAVAAGGK